MNMKFSLLLALLVVCVRQGSSLTCPTCRGSNCDQEVEEMECNRHSLPLPGVYKKDKIASADKEYRCLNLKYGPDDDVTEMKQCVEVEVGEDICKYISEHLNVKECSAPRNYLMGGLAGSNKADTAEPENTSLSTTETVSSTTTKTDSSTTTKTDSSTTNETTPSATTKNSSSATTENASSATTKNASSATTKTPSSTTQKPNSSGIHTSSVLTLMTAVLVWNHL